MDITIHIPPAGTGNDDANLKHTVPYKGTYIVIDGMNPIKLPPSTKVVESQLTAEEREDKKRCLTKCCTGLLSKVTLCVFPPQSCGCTNEVFRAMIAHQKTFILGVAITTIVMALALHDRWDQGTMPITTVFVALGVACFAYTFADAIRGSMNSMDQKHLTYVEKQNRLRINDYYQGVRQKAFYDQLENKTSAKGGVFSKENSLPVLEQVVINVDMESSESASSLVSGSDSSSESEFN
jgi:hypothetical protein